MKTLLLTCLALTAFISAAGARVIRVWTEAELEKASDLVVVARPISTRELEGTNSLGWFQGRFRNVETSFKVLDCIKGMPANDRIVLHNYREEPEGILPNGPTPVHFMDGDTNKSVLYLVHDGPDRYAPTAGQVDPGISVRPATDDFFHMRPPFLPPIADVDPSVCHPVLFRIPTDLKIERTADRLLLAIGTNSFESANLEVGSNMVTGFRTEWRVYPVGEPRPEPRNEVLMGGLPVLRPLRNGWNRAQDGIP